MFGGRGIYSEIEEDLEPAPVPARCQGTCLPENCASDPERYDDVCCPCCHRHYCHATRRYCIKISKPKLPRG